VGLWFDTMPCNAHMDSDLEAIVLPPIRLRHWNRLTVPLPFEAVLDARIVDPRFSEGRRPQFVDGGRPQQRRPDNRNLKPLKAKAPAAKAPQRPQPANRDRVAAVPEKPWAKPTPANEAAVEEIWSESPFKHLKDTKTAKRVLAGQVEDANHEPEPAFD
jgi:hypothetical protein